MRRVRIYVHNIITHMVVKERNKKNIPIINNVIMKKKMKRREADIDVSDHSRGV